MHRIQRLLQQDPLRLRALRAVRDLALPDCWIGAGFIRNMVWDELHGFSSTPLADVDVVYFDRGDVDAVTGKHAESTLAQLCPSLRWEVRNQALMHARNGDRPYQSTADALAHWPELETAVGARMKSDGEIVVLAPFGCDSLFLGELNRNPRRSIETFRGRLRDKGWLRRWPLLQVREMP